MDGSRAMAKGRLADALSDASTDYAFPQTPCGEVADMMVESGVGRVPVIDPKDRTRHRHHFAAGPAQGPLRADERRALDWGKFAGSFAWLQEQTPPDPRRPPFWAMGHEFRHMPGRETPTQKGARRRRRPCPARALAGLLIGRCVDVRDTAVGGGCVHVRRVHVRRIRR